MNKQKTVDSKVLAILRECPETRYDDMQLILCYYNRYSYMRVGDLPLEDIVNNYKGYYVTGGFGASANSRGSAVFCTNLHTGKSTRYERMDVMGEVKPERLPEWAKEKAQELSNKKRNKDKER